MDNTPDPIKRATPIHDGKMFHWTRDDGHGPVGTVEISTLTRGGIGDITSRMYHDAADVGLAVRSHKSGVVKRFYLAAENKDREGDVRYWNFIEEFPRSCAYRERAPIQLIVFNT